MTPASAPESPLSRWATLIVGVIPFVVLAPWLARGRVIGGGDMTAFFEPLAACMREGLLSGDLLRTPLLWNGLPLLGHPVAAVVYPPNWLVAVMPPATALTWLAVAHLGLAGAGTCAWLRAAGRTPLAAATAAIALMLSGIAVSSLVQPNLVRALAWMPWMLVAARAAVSTPAARWRGAASLAALAACTLMLLLTAEPFVVGPTLVAVAGHLALRPATDLAARLRAARPALIAMAAGAAAAAALLWPAWRHVAASERAAGFTPEGALQWSLHPAQALGFLVPRPFGDPRLFGLEGFTARTLLPDRVNEYFTSMHWGALALGLILAGALAHARERSGAPLFVGAAVLGWLALGANAPGAAGLHLIAGDGLRYPVKWLLPALLPLAALLARGADELACLEPLRRRRALLAVMACAIAAAATCALGGPIGSWIAGLGPEAMGAEPRAALAEAARVRLLAGGAHAAGFALLAIALVTAMRRHAPVALLLVLLVDLGWLAPTHLSFVPGEVFATRPAAARAALDLPGLQRLHVDHRARTGRLPAPPPRTAVELSAWHREALLYYTPASHGIELAFPIDIEAVLPLRLHQLNAYFFHAEWRTNLMLLGTAGVSHVASMDAIDDERLEPAGEIATSGGPLRFFRNRLVQPRARVVPAVRWFTSSAEFASILETAPDTLFATSTLVGRADWPAALGPPPAQDVPPGWDGHATIVAEPAGGVVVRTRATAPAVLVVSDAWLPGMRASVDGVPVPPFPADHAFIGLLVPAGEHEATIRYHPWR